MYTAFYNLKEQPFRLTPDPRFLHLAEPHRIALKVLLEGVLLRKGFLVMAGPVGTGKTTMLHAALHMLSERSVGTNRLATAFLVNPTLTRGEFLEAVLDEFEIACDSPSKPRRLAALHKMLLETQQRGSTAVLFVDEAHLLAPDLLEEIRLLSNADTYQEKLLQIVLCGQPELSALLDREELRALRQRIAASCQLRPLSLPETRAYVTERLYAAGLRGPGPFVGASLEAVHEFTGGVPRLINLLCDGCLSIGFASRSKQIEPDLVDEAAANLGLGRVQAAPALSHFETGLRPEHEDSNASSSQLGRSGEPVVGSELPLSSSSAASLRAVSTARPNMDESSLGLARADLRSRTADAGLPSSTSSPVQVIAEAASRTNSGGAKSTAAPNGSGRVSSNLSLASSSSASSHQVVAAARLTRDRSRSTLELLCDAFRQGRAAARE